MEFIVIEKLKKTAGLGPTGQAGTINHRPHCRKPPERRNRDFARFQASMATELVAAGIQCDRKGLNIHQRVTRVD